jgi:hypothetical protein
MLQQHTSFIHGLKAIRPALVPSALGSLFLLSCATARTTAVTCVTFYLSGFYSPASLVGVSMLVKSFFLAWASVSHACNPSYSGGGDQKDCGSKPAWTK